MSLPTRPKIYHILHVDRLASVLDDGVLWSDALVRERRVGGTTIGMGNIKRRRLEQNSLASHPGLRVGDCVPFYFCPRSIMLHLIWRANHPELTYRGGQDPLSIWKPIWRQSWSGRVRITGGGRSRCQMPVRRILRTAPIGLNWGK